MILRPTMRLIVFVVAALATCSPTYGFQEIGERILVTRNMRDLELVVGASQPLKFEYSIPKLLVQVPEIVDANACLLYTSPSPRDKRQSRMPSSA